MQLHANQDFGQDNSIGQARFANLDKTKPRVLPDLRQAIYRLENEILDSEVVVYISPKEISASSTKLPSIREIQKQLDSFVIDENELERIVTRHSVRNRDSLITRSFEDLNIKKTKRSSLPVPQKQMPERHKSLQDRRRSGFIKRKSIKYAKEGLTSSADNDQSEPLIEEAENEYYPVIVQITPEEETQGNVFINALHKSSLSTTSDEDTHVEFVPTKRKSQPVTGKLISYEEDVFDELVDLNCFFNIFRIESFHPVPIYSCDIGKFCVADCYIILVKEKDSFRIFTWIGNSAEIDKRFCCAMFAVGLRNWLNAPCRIQRETENDESEEFKMLFSDFGYQDNSNAAESGLFVTEQKRFPIRLYKVYGTGDLLLVNPVACSLKSESVFILDAGLEIFLWAGTRASLQHKNKARIISSRITMGERAGKATFTEILEGEECASFYTILSKGEKDLEEDKSQFEALSLAPFKLYKVDESTNELDQQLINIQKLAKSLLESSNCYILDAGTELYLWIGNESSPKTKFQATTALARIIETLKRPNWTALHRCAENNEPEVFKLRFGDWQVKSNIDKSKSKDELKPQRPSYKGDVLNLYEHPPNLSLDLSMVKETLEYTNSLLETFTCFVFQKGKYRQLGEQERGNMFSHDAYLFLCVYKLSKDKEKIFQSPTHRRMSLTRSISILDRSQLKSLDSDQDANECKSELQCENDKTGDEDIDSLGEEESLECVVYFWQGRHVSKLAYSSFLLKTLTEMETLVAQMYHCSLRVVRLEQGKETFALLSHFNNECIIHNGSRSEFSDKKACRTPKIYQIRKDIRYNTARAVETEFANVDLVSSDYYFIFYQEFSFLWIGRATHVSDLPVAKSLASRILEFYQLEDDTIELIYEGDEPEEFTKLFGERVPVISSLGNARFLSCGCSSGYFAVEEIPFYSQADCRIDHCIILDTGNHLFFWIGNSASQVVKTQSENILCLWQIQKRADGAFETTKINQGHEPRDFKSLFLAWDPVIIEEPLNLYLRQQLLEKAGK